jgi:8-oxo-dGTP pyrophosphatase MutT (NUDIX family)
MAERWIENEHAVHSAEWARLARAGPAGRVDAGRVARTAEFYGDRDAPRADGVLPAAFAVVRDGAGRVLLVRRADDLNWELPGGRIDVGESAVDAVVREVAEEAGLPITVTGLAGVYSDPSHVLVYAGEGARQQLAICFHARPQDNGGSSGNGAGGPPGPGRRPGSPGGHAEAGTGVRPDCVETVAAMWAERGELDRLVMHPAVRRRVDDAVTAPGHVHFD